MKALKFLIEKEFKQILRHPLIPKMILAYPLVVLLIFPWAIDFEIKNTRIDVVDNSHSTLSTRLINKIDASKSFILNNVTTNINEAYENVEKGNADMIIEIPSTFDSDLVKNKNSKVIILANAVSGTQGLLGINYVSHIINDFSGEIRAELMPKNINMGSNKSVGIIKVESINRFNPTLNYKIYLIPAFMVILITLICGILPSINIVTEKENGTINQINVTPVGKYEFILSKLIPYWIIGMILTILSMTIAYLIYGLYPSGNPLLIIFAAIVFIFSISGLGIIISNYSSNIQQAMFLVMFFILIIILLSGMFSPVNSMPEWAQVIAMCNPITHFILALRMTYLNGSVISDIYNQLLILLVFAVIFNGWAIISYKKRG